MRRPTIKKLEQIIDELLDKAVENLWVAATLAPGNQGYSYEREARGYWWGAFVLALELHDEVYTAWKWAALCEWVREAARGRSSLAAYGMQTPGPS